MELLCRQPPYRLAPAPRHSVSSPGIEPGLRSSQGRVRSATLREHISFQRPADESKRGTVRSMVVDLRRVLCDPLHHRDVQHPDLESNQVQGFRKALCDPLHHRDVHTRADDWIRTSMERFRAPCAAWSAAAFLNRATSAFKQECKDLNPVGRLWRPLPLPGGHSSIGPWSRDRGHRRVNYSRSVTFQYASLMNFDQLSIRMLWSA